MQALRSAGFDDSVQAFIDEDLPDNARGSHGLGKGISARRIDVEHQMGHVLGAVETYQRRVILNGALVPEPQQRPTVIAERVGDLALRRLRPHRHPLYP